MKISILEQNVVFDLENILFYLLSSSYNKRKRNSRNLYYEDIFDPRSSCLAAHGPCPSCSVSSALAVKQIIFIW